MERQRDRKVMIKDGRETEEMTVRRDGGRVETAVKRREMERRGGEIDETEGERGENEGGREER